MDTDEMTVEDMIDALGELEDDELLELRGAINEEIAERSAPIDDDEDFDDDEEDEE